MAQVSLAESIAFAMLSPLHFVSVGAISIIVLRFLSSALSPEISGLHSSDLFDALLYPPYLAFGLHVSRSQ